MCPIALADLAELSHRALAKLRKEQKTRNAAQNICRSLLEQHRDLLLWLLCTVYSLTFATPPISSNAD